MAGFSVALMPSGLRVLSSKREAGRWTMMVESRKEARCPDCGTISMSPHSTYTRVVADLPSQGLPVSLVLRARRWRCRAIGCARKTFADRLPGVIALYARRTQRLAEIVHLLGRCTGGRPAALLAGRLGMAISKDTILRHLRRTTALLPSGRSRVVGIDDWAWRKGSRYGTIIVDLEDRRVLDVLADRSLAGVADWLRGRPGIEIVARDRDGVYAAAIRKAVPHAAQVADRFHLLQNLRLAIEEELGGRREPIRARRPAGGGSQVASEAPIRVERGVRLPGREGRELMFGRVRRLFEAGHGLRTIRRETGLSLPLIRRWIRLDALPERGRMEPKSTTPRGFAEYLERRWQEGCTHVRTLLNEIREQGFTGSFSRLAGFLSPWRREALPGPDTHLTVSRPVPPTCASRPGALLSPVAAAALCVKPHGMLTPRQIVRVDLLKTAVPGFARMRALAMRFRGMMRGGSKAKLSAWLRQAEASGIYAMQIFARTLKRDLSAVRNALTMHWSSGQVEGQINKLKTLKRSMYGRAGVEILRARMLPMPSDPQHAL